MIKKLFPFGKAKAFNLTYDDGVTQDIRFIELLKKYNLKATFNLNSGLMKTQFEWTHESGIVIKRLSESIAKELYADFEVASHTLTHPYMDSMCKKDILHQLVADKQNLEKLFDRKIRGFALPFDYYSPLIEECVKEASFDYGRISEESLSFLPQSDFYNWKATVFHLNPQLPTIVDEFLKTEKELAVLQIVGHSYDLDTETMWDDIEMLLSRVSLDKSVLPMTTIEIVDYLKSMSNAVVTRDFILNNSEKSLWFEINKEIVEIKAKEKYNI